MKVLHTSDLHIGKKLMGRERYAEYRAVLSEISGICKAEGVELVLIAGDVFDTYTPSAEAEEIFYQGIKKLAENCAVLVISGNHDDYVRLTAASSLAQEFNVYIVGNNLSPIVCGKRGKVYPSESGEGWVVFSNDNGEKLYVNTLPYPNEARFKEGRTDESFEEKMARWISAGESGKKSGVPSIFLSHLFAAGGAVSDSEREIDLGGARAVPLSMLPECDYCALGHLHKRQKLGKNVYYCGAPMQFSFDECGTEKTVNVFDINANGIENFKQIPVTSAKKLIRLQTDSAARGVELLMANAEYYVELTLCVTQPLTPAESSALRLQENLLSLKADVKNAAETAEKILRKDKSASQLFSEFYSLRYGAEVSGELLQLFLSLTEEE